MLRAHLFFFILILFLPVRIVISVRAPPSYFGFLESWFTGWLADRLAANRPRLLCVPE